MNDCVSRVCVIMGWEWDGIGIGMAIPAGAAWKTGIGDPWEGCLENWNWRSLGKLPGKLELAIPGGMPEKTEMAIPGNLGKN